LYQQQWLDAGMTLGNHTYSHPDLNQQTVEQFQDDIIKGEVVTRRLMTAAKQELRWFRHPMTHTGDTKKKKEAVERFLAARSYRAAAEIDLLNVFFRVSEVAEEFGFGKVTRDRLKSGTRMPDHADLKGESGKVVHAAEDSAQIRLGVSLPCHRAPSLQRDQGIEPDS
jgi:peptidoglycan/xylan/chitin deacetylase (PgdA/CDA1 family)